MPKTKKVLTAKEQLTKLFEKIGVFFELEPFDGDTVVEIVGKMSDTQRASILSDVIVGMSESKKMRAAAAEFVYDHCDADALATVALDELMGANIDKEIPKMSMDLKEAIIDHAAGMKGVKLEGRLLDTFSDSWIGDENAVVKAKKELADDADAMAELFEIAIESMPKK